MLPYPVVLKTLTMRASSAHDATCSAPEVE